MAYLNLIKNFCDAIILAIFVFSCLIYLPFIPYLLHDSIIKEYWTH